MKKIFKNIFLGLALTACAVSPFGVAMSLVATMPKKTAGDYIDIPSEEPVETKFENLSIKGDDSYVSVGELWDNDTRTFNKDNVRILLRYMGLENATLDEVTTKAGEKLRASDMRSVVTSAGVQGDIGYTAKKSNQNINVMLGGIEWTVCYLSQDNSGNPVLTLMMSNSIQDAFAGRSQEEGAFYGYLTDENGTSLHSSWAATWYKGSIDAIYPVAMYGTSYIRAVTLNNGGKYSVDGEDTLSKEVEQDENSAFAIFTMKDDDDLTDDLTDYITTPSEMSWQENQSSKTYGASYNNPNDAWGIQDDAGFYAGYNYSTKENYDTWKNDKLWLPSKVETGWTTSGTQGMWGLNVYQKMNYDGKTNIVSGSIGRYKKTVVWTTRWLRSGYYGYFSNINCLYSGSGTETFMNANNICAVCPSLHLSLENILDDNSIIVSFDTGDKELGVYENEKYSNLPVPTKDGKYFAGWFLDSSLTNQVTSETIVTKTENHTLYAKWVDDGYVINYKECIKDGDTYSTPVEIVDSTLPNNIAVDTEFKLKILTKQGYFFKGWKIGENIYYNENGGNVYLSNLTSSGNSVDVIAVWERDKDAQLVTYKTYDEYFTDNDISTSTMNNLILSQSSISDIEAENYQKQGYDLVICNNSTYYILTQKGFMYLTNNSLSKISLANKNLELYCDIVLNEEYFDDNGKVICNADGVPTQGDGIVYSWKPNKSWTTYNLFDGHGYTIYGVYYNNPESTSSSFLGTSYIKELKNLNMQGVFFRIVNDFGIMAYQVGAIENCHILSGTMIASVGNSAGLTSKVYKSLKNCSNNANIIAGTQVSGIVYSVVDSSVVIEGAINYGNITCGYLASGILVHQDSENKHVILKNCKNYGKIIGATYRAGIIGKADGNGRNTTLISCENHGEILGNNDGGTGDGMVACYSGSWNLIGCKNYGECRGLMGEMAVNKSQSTNLYIKDCYSYSEVNKAPIYSASANSHVEIDGLTVEYDINGNYTTGIIQSVNSTAEVNVQNVSVKAKCKQFSGVLINRVNNAKNIFADIDCTSISTRANYLCGNTDFYANGVMLNIHTSSTSIKQYYGSNFSGFYVSWRTGKIGLKSLDGVGYFQGAIDEAWLGNNGFVKKN